MVRKMAKPKMPTTQAIRTLNRHGTDFVLHSYKYQEKGGTASASEALGVEEHRVIKTLVMERDDKQPFLVLMHGDKRVSTKEMARTLGVKAVSPCEPQTANRHTGYVVGGISPFGTKKPLKVYVEESILSLDRIFINAGKRGLLAEIFPRDLVRILKAEGVKVMI